MARRLKLLTGLSTVALTGALALVACSGQAEGEGEDAKTSASRAPADSEGEAEGEGAVAASVPTPPTSGEGEGGVDIAAAASDPVVFLSALAIAEAHVLAARDAYAAGHMEEAAGMFAHPVGEVLADMEGALKARGVNPVNALFIEASESALSEVTPEQISARTDAIIAALVEAAKKAPHDGRNSGQVAAGVVSDQIDRAVDMYRLASASGDYGSYLDGYGFFKAAESVFNRNRTTIAADTPEAAATIEAALAALGSAYPGAGATPTTQADIAALSAASSRVMLSIGR